MADFMHAAKVKRQYRSFIRLANFIDGRGNATGASSECRAAVDEVRVAYRQGMKKDVDSLSKKMAFSEVRQNRQPRPGTAPRPDLSST